MNIKRYKMNKMIIFGVSCDPANRMFTLSNYINNNSNK